MHNISHWELDYKPNVYSCLCGIVTEATAAPQQSSGIAIAY
jgi:hypothetical protein